MLVRQALDDRGDGERVVVACVMAARQPQYHFDNYDNVLPACVPLTMTHQVWGAAISRHVISITVLFSNVWFGTKNSGEYKNLLTNREGVRYLISKTCHLMLHININDLVRSIMRINQLKVVPLV